MEKRRKINLNEKEKETKGKKVSLVELNNNKQTREKRGEEGNNIDME